VLSIRAFHGQADLEGLVWLENGVLGSNLTVDELARRDATRAADLAWLRLVARLDWQIVGAIEATQKPSPWLTRAEVRVGVRPDHRGRGIGRALVLSLESHLREAGAGMMLAYTGEFDFGYNHFLWRVGFSEVFRGYPQYLPLQGVNLERISVDWGRIAEAGVEFRTLAEVRFEWDCAAKLYALYTELEADVPQADAAVAPKSFEAFCADIFDSPSSLPDGVMLAVRLREWGMEYIGCNVLYRDDAGQVLHNGLTGVRREWRGLGLALALKYKGIEFARNAGFVGITTFNASENSAILTLNQKFGFERGGATLEWRKPLT
jgi:mycothiol synthase